MEEGRQRKAVFELVRDAMPKVAELVAQQRRRRGDAFIVECQRRGMGGEPGWFYAWEAGVCVGTPWPAAMAIVDQVDPRHAHAQKAVVVFREQEGDGHGA